ncbi:Mitochondrial phosphate carrier protein 3, mitochondrial [Glycine max]|nr:Mitochondrial phosphate carrier protein 3, mitochondrial [Glycine max]
MGKTSSTYTMMKFASYENIVEMIYKHAIPKPKHECSNSLQLGVSIVGGYMAGILCAIISHPADNLVSFLNNSKGATVGDAVKKLGLWGLFTRGLPLCILMVGTLSLEHNGEYMIHSNFCGAANDWRCCSCCCSYSCFCCLACKGVKCPMD